MTKYDIVCFNKALIKDLKEYIKYLEKNLEKMDLLIPVGKIISNVYKYWDVSVIGELCMDDIRESVYNLHQELFDFEEDTDEEDK